MSVLGTTFFAMASVSIRPYRGRDVSVWIASAFSAALKSL